MSAEFLRKIKAVLLIAVVAGAEVHQVEHNVRLNHMQNLKSQGSVEITGMDYAAQAKLLAQQMEAVAGLGAEQEQVKDVALQIEAMMADPALHERTERLAKLVKTFNSDAHLQKLAKNIDEQVKAMKGDVENQEQMNRVAEQLEETMKDPYLQQQLKGVEKQMNALLADENLQQYATAIDKAKPEAQEQAQAAPEQMDALSSQIAETMADPELNQQAERIAERMKVVLADPKIQEQARRIGEQAVALDGNVPSQEQMNRIEKQMDALMSNPNMHELGKRVAEQMEAMAADPHMQDLAQRLKQASEEPAAEESSGWADTMVDQLVDNVATSTGLFNRANKASSIEQADLDEATVAKTGTAARRLSTIPSARTHNPRVMNIPQFRKYSNVGPRAPKQQRGEAVVPKSLEAIFAGEGVQKTLQFLAIGAAGAYLRPEFTNIMKPEMTAGAQTLMLQAMVPALVFKSLATVSMSTELIAYVAFGALLSIYRFATGWVISTGVYGKSDAPELGVMRRSSAHMLSGMAPALSSFPFIGEFVGPAAVGYGALIDLPNKVWVLLILPILLRLWSPVKAEEVKSESSGDGMGKLLKALGEPFNIAIIGGLTMIATGTKMSALGFVGKAIMAMSDSVTPTLFLILGLKLNLAGSTPTLCATLLFLRHGLLALGMSALLAVAGTAITPKIALALVIMSQSAVSVVSTGLINAATTSGVQGYSTDIGIDLCGYSFPFSTLLAATTCILGDFYVNNLPFVGLGWLGLAAAVGLPSLKEFRDPNTWSEMTAKAWTDGKPPAA